VGVLRLAHAIDRSGVREIHHMVRALLHVQATTRRPGLDRGVRASRRDDPHATVEGAKDGCVARNRRGMLEAYNLTFLFSLDSHSKQAGDECHLLHAVSFFYAMDLS